MWYPIKKLYNHYGTSKIASLLDISKPTVLRNLNEYNIPKRSPGAPTKLPEYWKKALRKKKSVPSHLKGKTKYNNKTLAKVSNSLKGEKNYAHKIMKETNCTFGSCLSNIKILDERKLIVYEKNNKRNKYIKLTTKGREVIKLLNKLENY